MSKHAAKTLRLAREGRNRAPIGILGLLGLVALGVLFGVAPAEPEAAVPASQRPAAETEVPATALRPLGTDAWLGMGRLAPRRLERLLDRINDAREHCLEAGTIDRRSPGKAKLTRLFEILSKSSTARALFETARRRDVIVCVDARTDLLAYYVEGLRLVGVNPTLSEGQQVAFLAHELSHIPQHPVHSDDRRFSAGDLVLLRRTREAAAEALATCIAWELREAGYPDAWNDKRHDDFYGDIVEAFSNTRASSGDMLPAMRAAYDQWFAKEARRRLYDAMTVEHLARIASDSIGLVTPVRVMRHDFLLTIGQTSQGNYLASNSARSLTDAYYAGDLSREHAAELESLLAHAGILIQRDVPNLSHFPSREALTAPQTSSAGRPASNLSDGSSKF